MAANETTGGIRPLQPKPITANLSIGDVVTELELSIDHDAELGLVVVGLVRSDGAMPGARLVFAQDPALDLALRLTAAVMRLRGQRA